jgi:hypothetical protein
VDNHRNGRSIKELPVGMDVWHTRVTPPDECMISRLPGVGTVPGQVHNPHLSQPTLERQGDITNHNLQGERGDQLECW